MPGSLLQQFLEAQRDVEHELGFGDAVAHRAGIVAAVARIDDDARDAEAELAGHREAAAGVLPWSGDAVDVLLADAGRRPRRGAVADAA